MALMPKRVKFRKWQKGRLRGKAKRGNYVAFGEYGLQALEAFRITTQQIEAGRVTASQFLGGEGKTWIRVFPHRSVTAKPEETRMGKGKGEPKYWVAHVKPGTILYELGGIPEDLAREAFNRIAHKMPVKCRFVTRRHRL